MDQTSELVDESIEQDKSKIEGTLVSGIQVALWHPLLNHSVTKQIKQCCPKSIYPVVRQEAPAFIQLALNRTANPRFSLGLFSGL